MRLGSGLFEAVHLRRREIAAEPHQPVLTLGRVADGGILGGVLSLEQLVADAGQVRRRLRQEGFAVRQRLVAALLLLLQLVQPLVGNGKLRGGVSAGQRCEGRQRRHLAYRSQPHEANVGIGLQRGHGLFVSAVDVDLPALLLQLPQLRRNEPAPFGQLFRRRVGACLLLQQRLFAAHAVGQLLIEGFKFAVGQHRRLLRGLGILLQRHCHPGQLGEALQMPLVGAGLFREVDNAQLPQLIQQRCFFQGGRHNVDDLHFFDHRPTSCSFFLAILPRTTAEVCWSPR